MCNSCMLESGVIWLLVKMSDDGQIRLCCLNTSPAKAAAFIGGFYTLLCGLDLVIELVWIDSDNQADWFLATCVFKVIAIVTRY